MKKSILLLPLLALLILGALFSFRTEKSALLRLNLAKGASYLYSNTFSQNMATQMGGQPVNMKLDMQATMNVQVTEKYADSMRLKAAYSHVAFSGSSMGRHTTFDSDSSKGRFSNLFSVLQAHPVTIRTDRRGRITNMDGLPQLRTAVKAALPSNQGVQHLVDNLLDDKTFANNFTNLGLFPAGPVTVGDHWERDISMNNMVATNVHTTYTVRDISAGKVLLGVNADIANAADSANINGMLVPVKITGTQSGTYTVDRSTGLLSGDLDQKMKVTLSIMGQDMVMDITGKNHVDETAAPSR